MDLRLPLLLVLLSACEEPLGPDVLLARPSAVDWGVVPWNDPATDTVVVGIVNVSDHAVTVDPVSLSGTGVARVAVEGGDVAVSLEPGQVLSLAVSLALSPGPDDLIEASLDVEGIQVPLGARLDCDLDLDTVAALACGGSDCDDLDALSYPGGIEWCNGLDDDCDGQVDEYGQDGSRWYTDADGDGHGTGTPVPGCSDPGPGWALEPDDCDDASPLRYPGAPERCDEVDTDCDGETWDTDALDALTWYTDVDEDGFGDPDTGTPACLPAPGQVVEGTDCDDRDPDRWPGAPEVCGDGQVNDCGGTADLSAAVCGGDL